MNDVDNNPLNITFLLEKLIKCRRGHFRITQEIREKMKKVLCRGSYNLDGYSLHDVMRACVLVGLDALLSTELDLSVAKLMNSLQRTALQRGRPYGSPNQH